MARKNKFVSNRIKSIGFAFKGGLLLLKSESSIQIQFVIAIIVIIAGIFFDISYTEWLIQIIAITLVITAEGLNTAVEKLSDFVQPEHDTKIAVIKDIAAGAVLFAAIGAIIIGILIYFPKIF